MPLDIKHIQKINKKVLAGLSTQDKKKRYPKYKHTKDHPLARPKLHCVISRLQYDASGSEVVVQARVKNVGSGASTRTKVQFHFAEIPLVIVGGTPTDVRTLMRPQSEELVTLEPGEAREFEFRRDQRWLFGNWQAAVLAFDPIADTLPMANWPRLMQPLDNLLNNADNPSTASFPTSWQQYDETAPGTFTKRAGAQRTWRGRNGEPNPLSRTSYMGIPLSSGTYFQAKKTATDVSELRQSVSIGALAGLLGSGDLGFRLSGFVRSHDQGGSGPRDRTQMILECLASDGDPLASVELGVNDNADAWRAVAGQLSAPLGTSRVRVRLRSERRAGQNNDGYFDVISLIATHRQISTLDRGDVA